MIIIFVTESFYLHHSITELMTLSNDIIQ